MKLLRLIAALSICLAACSSKTSGDNTSAPTETSTAQSETTAQDSTSDAAADAGQPEVDAAPEPTVAELAMDYTAPMPQEVRDSLEAIEYDPYPEELVRNSHYWVSNENFHHLYKKHIDNHGGIYSGVGTDQNYLMAAWAKSPIIITMDFDEEIRRVHEIYGVILRRVDKPDALIKAWREKEKVEGWIDADFKDKKVRKDLKKTFRSSRGVIRARLNKVQKRYEELEIASFLTDQEQFEFIRDLWRNNRVVALRGDLTGSVTMVQLAAALKKHDLTLGLLYTSNAEQYFPFSPEFRRNVISLPKDDKAMVLRTRPYWGLGVAMDPLPELDEKEQKRRDKKLEEMTEEEREEFLEEEKKKRTAEYHYNVHPLPNFQKWLEVSQTEDVLPLLRKQRTNDPDVKGLSVITAEPKVSTKAPEIAPTP